MHAAAVAAVTLGAFLVFLLEPLVGKALLPTFGGSAAVWGACLVFFQAVVFGGYAYAHGAARKLGPRTHVVAHVALLMLAALALPVSFASQPLAATAPPALRVLLTLALAVGLPTFVVSATAPLVQRLSLHVDPTRDPYLLYAASNAGSLLALGAYPFVIETRVGLRHQAMIWSVGFALLLALFVLIAVFVRRVPDREVSEREKTEAPTWAARVRWIWLSAVPSALLVEVTLTLTTDVSPIPLLWVLPLALYLLTFIIAFGGRPQLSSWAGRFLPLAAAAGIGLSLGGARAIPALALHTLAFGVVVLALHDKLARERPAPDHLTTFFLWTSFGGVVGGAFASFLAPVLFVVPIEYPLTLGMAAFVWWENGPASDAPVDRRRVWLHRGVAVFLGVEAIVLLRAVKDWALGSFLPLLLAAIPAFVLLPASSQRFSRRLAFAALLVAALIGRRFDPPMLYVGRDFYGAVHVVDDVEIGSRRFVHGTTLHGLQRKADPKTPASYYHPTGPFGDVRRLTWPADARFGLAGLGTGSLAAHARPGEDWTFYEISPLVRDVAENASLFTFVHDAFPDKQRYRTLVGDARLAIANEPAGAFDAIVLDAFSSDSIPVHLLTTEALTLYLRRLKPDGLLVFHVSNNYVDVASEVLAVARALDRPAACKSDGVTLAENASATKLASQWCVLASRIWPAPLSPETGWRKQPDRLAPPWTDDRSSVLPLLK